MEVQGQYLFTTSIAEFRVYQVDALTAIESSGEITPQEFTLHPCYPNPFNASTVLGYSLKQPGEVTLSIHNILGQKVVTLMDGRQQSGNHSIIWNANDLASGIYYAKLQSSNEVMCIKMVLTK